MAYQTSYKENMDAGVLGAIADTNNKTLFSRNADEEFGFAVPLAQGVSDYSCRKAVAGDTEIIGVSVLERSAVGPIGMVDGYRIGDEVRVMNEGTIWLKSDLDVVAGDPVFVVLATSTFANAGDVQITNARFEQDAIAGDLVRVRMS